MQTILEKDKIHIQRTGVIITQKCNLKCKLCIGFMPYYENPIHFDLTYIENTFRNYFQVVDFVNILTIVGGEPCMHKSLKEIFKLAFNYKEQFGEIHLVTNATVKFSEDLLSFFTENKSKVKVILSDYGDGLSKYFQYNTNKLQELGLNHRVSTFHGENLYYGGWIDFRDHSIKWDTVESRNKNASKCIHRYERHFVINNGELHSCNRSFWRSYNEIIPKIKGEYVAINDENLSLEEKRVDLINMAQLASSSSCARCVGLVNDAPRHKPAEQLK